MTPKHIASPLCKAQLYKALCISTNIAQAKATGCFPQFPSQQIAKLRSFSSYYTKSFLKSAERGVSDFSAQIYNQEICMPGKEFISIPEELIFAISRKEGKNTTHIAILMR